MQHAPLINRHWQKDLKVTCTQVDVLSVLNIVLNLPHTLFVCCHLSGTDRFYVDLWVDCHAGFILLCDVMLQDHLHRYVLSECEKRLENTSILQVSLVNFMHKRDNWLLDVRC